MYIVKETFLEPVEHHPYLGLELQSNMKWDHHIKEVTVKESQTLVFLCRNFSKCLQLVKEHVYNALVHPHLEYASWDPYLDKGAGKLNLSGGMLQDQLCTRERICYKLITRPRIALPTKKTKVHRLEMVDSNINGQSALQIPNYLNNPAQRTTRTLHGTCFLHTKTTVDNYRYSFFPTISDWNLLPSRIRHSQIKESIWLP